MASWSDGQLELGSAASALAWAGPDVHVLISRRHARPSRVHLEQWDEVVKAESTRSHFILTFRQFEQALLLPAGAAADPGAVEGFESSPSWFKRLRFRDANVSLREAMKDL